MNSRAMFAIIVLLIAVTTSPAGDTNQPAVSTGQLSGFHQKNPWAVGCGMKGTVTNVSMIDGRIQFKLTGWFWFHQYPEGGTNGEQVIKVNCERGISATVTPDSFVAFTPDWRAGSVVNDKGRLLEILKTAAKRGTEVRFALTEPKVDFGGKNGFTILDGKVWRITDVDLR
jgi:hypothetical protein